MHHGCPQTFFFPTTVMTRNLPENETMPRWKNLSLAMVGSWSRNIACKMLTVLLHPRLLSRSAAWSCGRGASLCWCRCSARPQQLREKACMWLLKRKWKKKVFFVNGDDLDCFAVVTWTWCSPSIALMFRSEVEEWLAAMRCVGGHLVFNLASGRKRVISILLECQIFFFGWSYFREFCSKPIFFFFF